VAQIALAWLLHQEAVTSVIIGAKRMDQLEDNLASPSVKLTEEELRKLDEASALSPEYPGWMLERQAGGRLPNE
jgi:aryl-alcohol dehydrogenase-like predicted oxidoreductase